jgi:hypothetical protein
MKYRTCTLALALGLATTGLQAAPTVTLLRNTTLSSNATTVKSYDTNVNVASYRHQGILYYGGYQYVSWYNGNARNVIVARRTFNSSTLAAGSWTWAYVNFTLAAGADSHNVISMGISPNDGRLHLAIGTHGGQLYWISTKAKTATGSTWDNTVFGGTASTPAAPVTGLGSSAATGNVTYPYFVNAGDSAKTLQLAYRTGSSGNGQLQLAEYTPNTSTTSTGTWKVIGQFTGSTGSYTQNNITSTTRNAYPHGFTYDYAGRLHMAFTWRENLSTAFISSCGTSTINNHDTAYVYSDDKGRTWKNSAGTQVGKTGSSQITVSSSGIVVDTLAVGRDLMNQETQIMDRNNLFHAMISYVPGRYQSTCATSRSVSQPFHLWRSATGAWTKVEMKLGGADVNQGYDRSKMFFGLSNNLYVVLPDLRIVGATASTNWTDWTLLYDGRSLGNYGETIIDYNLTRLANGVSVMYMKNTSSTTGELHVLDFKTGG